MPRPERGVTIEAALLWVNVLAAGMMAGLIWFVQVVHYPLFARVGSAAFESYERGHQSRTTLVVAPLMLAELVAAGSLVVLRPRGVPPGLLVASAALVAAAWLLTFAVSVPLHARLARGFDPRAHRLLVLTNWPRAAVWTARAAVSIAMLQTAVA